MFFSTNKIKYDLVGFPPDMGSLLLLPAAATPPALVLQIFKLMILQYIQVLQRFPHTAE